MKSCNFGSSLATLNRRLTDEICVANMYGRTVMIKMTKTKTTTVVSLSSGLRWSAWLRVARVLVDCMDVKITLRSLSLMIIL